jgi:hypothetical protein
MFCEYPDCLILNIVKSSDSAQVSRSEVKFRLLINHDAFGYLEVFDSILNELTQKIVDILRGAS